MVDSNPTLRVVDLVKHSSVYGIGALVLASSGFLLIPLYTRVLSTLEFGSLEILNRIADIMLLFMFLGMRQAYIRIYFENTENDWRCTVTSTFLWFSLISCLVIVLGLYPWAGEAVSIFYELPELKDSFSLLLLLAPLSMFAKIVMTYLQVRTWSAAYVWSSITQTMFFLGFSVYFLAWLDLGVQGALLAAVISSGLIATAGTIYIFHEAGYKFSVQIFVEMLRFGLPYLPTAFFAYVILNSDRYFLSSHASLDSVGIYALSYKIAMIGVFILVEPFLKIWSPFLYQVIKQKNGKVVIANVFRYFVICTVGIATLISVLAESVISVLSDRAYHAAIHFVPILAFASVFWAAQHLADAGILIAKKTSFKPLIFGMAAFTAVTLNWALVPKFGIMGASFATFLTYVVLFLATLKISNYYYFLPLEYAKLSLTIFAGVCTFGIANIATGESSGILNVTISLFCFLVYPILIWFGGALTKSEINKATNIFLRKIGKSD